MSVEYNKNVQVWGLLDKPSTCKAPVNNNKEPLFLKAT